MPKKKVKTQANWSSEKMPAERPWASEQAFERAVGVAAARGKAGTPHVLFVMHVERLNDIARGCGPDAESAVLDLIALVLSNIAGEEFPYCRLDTDRIAVIKRGCAPSRAADLAGQFRASIEGGIFTWHGRQFRLGVSVGAVVLLMEAEGPSVLISRAREASIAAQALGTQTCLMLNGTARETAHIRKNIAWFEHLSETIV